jgi:hypothetical protein
MKTIITILLATVLSASAADRFLALAEVESADATHPTGNDAAVGPDGEVSRFQITREQWAAHTTLPLLSAQNPFTAENVARLIMEERVRAFVLRYRVQPSDAQWYCLWHRPARLLLDHPLTVTKIEAERAQRFANLCAQP